MHYPKIDTLWNRDEKTFKVIPGAFRLPEFAIVKRWTVTEKIHGCNVRVELHADGTVAYYGRGDDPLSYPGIVDWLHSHLPAEVVAPAFDPGTEAILFGEGYGPRIQKGGGNYRADVSFRLFDVAVLTPVRVWWLNWLNVEDVALKLGIVTVPVLARNATLDEAMALVKMPSMVAHYDGGVGCEQEGIVCRTDPLLFTRNGSRLVFKLKARDLPEDCR